MLLKYALYSIYYYESNDNIINYRGYYHNIEHDFEVELAQLRNIKGCTTLRLLSS